MLVCVCYHVFANLTGQWGIVEVLNLAFSNSIKVLHLKVNYDAFHFRLNTLYVCYHVLPNGAFRVSWTYKRF